MTHERQLLETEENRIKLKMDELFRLVEDALDKSFRSMAGHDTATAARILEEDTRINALQQRIDQLCIETIALQQPVASDLRALMADVRISLELERIADHAAAIAGIMLRFEDMPAENCVQPLNDVAERCRSMYTLVKQAYDEGDEGLARDVAVLDDEIDQAEQEINELMFREFQDNPEQLKTCAYLTWITHNLERIGDHITNISERIVYMLTNETTDLNS